MTGEMVDQLSRVLCARLMLLILVIISGCASPPPPPPPPKPTIIRASFDVDYDVNPDTWGRASPIVVRFYELKTLAAFNSADFFSLWDKDRETLGGDLVAREEIHLRPGEWRRFDRTLLPDSRHVAVVAAFRDLDRARWRGAIGVLTNQTSPVTIKLADRSISISGK